jgi:hypothetical protein
MFLEAKFRLIGAADVEPFAGLTSQDVHGRHTLKVGPGPDQTDDLPGEAGTRSAASDSEVGGPGRDRTDDLFHAMEARSQLRHRPT